MKTKNLKILAVGLVAALLFAVPTRPVSAQMEKNTLCPVMPGTPVKEKFYLDYQGRRIFFCCRSCVKAFKKHPEKYLKNLVLSV